jgi:sphingomyelin phosphodiesterase
MINICIREHRYESTIKGQFYGHTHVDQFSVYYNEDGDPSSVAIIDPSISPFLGFNYAYRIYHVDGARDADSTWV